MPGDEFALWASGRLSGVYPLGVITAPAEHGLVDDPYWTDSGDASRPGWHVGIRIQDQFADDPVPKKELAQDPQFAGASILRIPRGRNPFQIADYEWQAILRHRRAPANVSALGESHRRRLMWFEEHAGEVLPRPEPLDGALPLVHRRQGIYKPAGLEYATAIIAMISSPYAGDRVTRLPGGAWEMLYHQENPRAGQDADPYANQGLRARLRDRVPVGVLQERPRTARSGPRMFEVLGLGVVTGWQSGYFVLQSLAPPGDSVGALLSAAESLEDAEDEPLPASDDDARLRVLRLIVARRGQAAFRTALLRAYSGRCAVTDCEVRDVLEAAHLRPYRGPASNDVRNGLLLRADIHTLLDLGLIAFDRVSEPS